MFQKRLKKELNKIEVPAYDTHKYKETIAKAKKIKLHPENLRMSSTEFFCNQLRFIKTETWILKIIVSALVLYLLITEQINISSWFWTLIAISGPILCLINAKELCNVFQPGMLEIQITAKNSFSKVLMVRLTIFGLFDLLFFMTMALRMSMLKQTVIWQVILYGIVPYIIMCFGCMLILNRSREENIPLYSGAWGACLSCIITILKISDVKIFQTSYLGIWIGIGLIALLGMMIEMRKLLKRAGGNLNEISYGTPF